MDISLFDTWDDGSLRCAVSPDKNEGTASMANFVRQHMLSILKPINEHILELQQRAQQIEANLERAAERELEHRNLVDHRIMGLFSEQEDVLSTIRGDIKMLRDNLHESDRRGESLHGEFLTAQKTLEETMKRVAATEFSVEEAQKDCTTIHARISDMLPRLDSFSESLVRLKADFGEFRQSHVVLQRQHADLSRCHGHTTQICEDAHERLSALASECETQKAEVSHAIVALHDRCFDNEKYTLELQDQVEGFEERNRHVDSNVEFLMKNVGGVEKNLEKWKDESQAQEDRALSELATASVNVQTVAERISVLENGISKLKRELLSEIKKTALAQDELGKEMYKSSANIHKNSSEIHNVEVVQQQILSNVHKCDSQVAQLLQQEHVWKERIDTIENAVTSFKKFGEDTAMKINTHALELEQGKIRHNQLHNNLGETNSAFTGLKDEFATTNTDLLDINARLGLAHEYIDGLGKGLQDTHRHSLSGTGGMLPSPSKVQQTTRILPGISTKGSPHKTAW